MPFEQDDQQCHMEGNAICLAERLQEADTSSDFQKGKKIVGSRKI